MQQSTRLSVKYIILFHCQSRIYFIIYDNKNKETIISKTMGQISAGRLIQLDLVTLVFNLNHWCQQNESELGRVLYSHHHT